MFFKGNFLSELLRAVVVLIMIGVLVGLCYPLLMTGIGQTLFPKRSAGSLIFDQVGRVTGSSLIGQNFTAPADFWGRPSASHYNPLVSGGSNLGPTNPQLLTDIKARIAILAQADPTQTEPVPIDLVTASGSGLDPDISVASAQYQAHRVAVARHMNLEAVNASIEKYTIERQGSVLGEPYVNVVLLNQALNQVGS